MSEFCLRKPRSEQECRFRYRGRCCDEAQIKICFLKDWCRLPVKNSIAKWPCRTTSAKKQIPNLGSKSLGLRVGGKTDLASCATDTECDHFPFRLAGLDVAFHGRLAIRESRTREDWIVPLAANL